MNKLLTVGLLVIFLVALGVGVYFNSQLPNDDLDVIEIREYEGKDLSSINTFRENSIKGPQYIDETNYSLSILGLNGELYELSYGELLSVFPSYKKVVTLHCVEGWSVTILWEGIRIVDVLEELGINLEGKVIIFRAYDGYSTSLPMDYIVDNEIFLSFFYVVFS